LAAANIPADLDAVLADTNELQGDWTDGGRLDLIIDALATTADLLDKLGAVGEAASTGDPNATDSVIQYVKQIVNILIGSSGIAAFPAEAAPANAVSLAEVIRAIHADVTGLGGTTAAAIADGVLDELTSGHTTEGSLGERIQSMDEKAVFDLI